MVCKITLVVEDHETDSIGNQVPIKTRRAVFADDMPIAQSEFFACAQRGIKPEKKLLVWTHEYKNETLVEHGGTVYAVYRTYPNGDKTELYLKGCIGNGAAL